MQLLRCTTSEIWAACTTAVLHETGQWPCSLARGKFGALALSSAVMAGLPIAAAASHRHQQLHVERADERCLRLRMLQAPNSQPVPFMGQAASCVCGRKCKRACSAGKQSALLIWASSFWDISSETGCRLFEASVLEHDMMDCMLYRSAGWMGALKGLDMSELDFETLSDALKIGGPSALSEVTELEPAGGPQTLVAPAKYKGHDHATYVFERRYMPGENGKEGTPVNTVLIDSRTSEANRVEQALRKGIEAGQPTLCSMPTMVVEYALKDGSKLLESDLELPHRAFDAHFRLGYDSENPDQSFIKNAKYIEARNSTPADASALFKMSPITVLLGGWDSTRKSHQARFASCVTGEIVGILSDQDSYPLEDSDKLASSRSGARVDPVGSGIYFSQSQADAISDRLGKAHEKAKKGKVSGSEFVIGAIPPSVGGDALDGISVSRIARSRVLSFAALRSLSFGCGPDGDHAIRMLLAALAIDGIARADAELYLRANAHLVEAGKPVTVIHKRFGEKIPLDAIEVGAADELLDAAYQQAHELAGVDWHGQRLRVIGDPVVIQSVNDTADAE